MKLGQTQQVTNQRSLEGAEGREPEWQGVGREPCPGLISAHLSPSGFARWQPRGLCERVLGEGTPIPEGAAGVRILKEGLPHPEQAGPLPGPQPARVTALTVPSVWLTGLPMPAAGALLSTALTEGARWAGLEALRPVPAWLAGLTAARVCRARLVLLAVATAGGKRSSWEAPGANGRSAHPGLQGPWRASRSQLTHSGRFAPPLAQVVLQRGWINDLYKL